jgi:hypothetical protein
MDPQHLEFVHCHSPIKVRRAVEHKLELSDWCLARYRKLLQRRLVRWPRVCKLFEAWCCLGSMALIAVRVARRANWSSEHRELLGDKPALEHEPHGSRLNRSAKIEMNVLRRSCIAKKRMCNVNVVGGETSRHFAYNVMRAARVDTHVALTWRQQRPLATDNTQRHPTNVHVCVFLMTTRSLHVVDREKIITGGLCMCHDAYLCPSSNMSLLIRLRVCGLRAREGEGDRVSHGPAAVDDRSHVEAWQHD